jgi:hypothetical protein
MDARRLKNRLGGLRAGHGDLWFFAGQRPTVRESSCWIKGSAEAHAIAAGGIRWPLYYNGAAILIASLGFSHAVLDNHIGVDQQGTTMT